MRYHACVIAMLLAVGTGFAAEPPPTSNPGEAAAPDATIEAAAPTAVPAKRDSPNISMLIENQQDIRAEIESGKGKYRGMPARERRDLYAHQDNLLSLLDGKQSFDELKENDKLEAFNELEWIKARLTQAEDDRLVCEVVRSSGSNLTKRVCKSAKQLRLQSEQAQQMLDTKGQCIITNACGSGT